MEMLMNKLKLMLSLVLLFSLSLIGCTNQTDSALKLTETPSQALQKTPTQELTNTPKQALPVEYYQNTMDAFLALRNKFTLAEGHTNINDYFTVLTHLKPEAGYVLDYYYHEEEDFGLPILYARSIEQYPPHDLSSEQYPLPDSSIKQYPSPDLSFGYDNQPAYVRSDWPSHIQVEDTEMGYFEYILLHEMGNQFKLYWHALMDDYTIIFDQFGLKKEDEEHNLMECAPDFWEKARQVDLKPKFDFKEDYVDIQIVGFTSNGGLSRRTFRITRMFPNTNKSDNFERLIKVYCGVIY
jgi:hypothetical protein